MRLTARVITDVTTRLHSEGYPPIEGNHYHVVVHPDHMFFLEAEEYQKPDRPITDRLRFDVAFVDFCPTVKLFVNASTPRDEARVIATGAVEIVPIDLPED